MAVVVVTRLELPGLQEMRRQSWDSHCELAMWLMVSGVMASFTVEQEAERGLKCGVLDGAAMQINAAIRHCSISDTSCDGIGAAGPQIRVCGRCASLTNTVIKPPTSQPRIIDLIARTTRH